MDELYLSRIVLEPRNRLVQRWLADCRALHQRIMMGFPSTDAANPREAFGVLYRVGINPRLGVPTLLVQSHVRPDWTAGFGEGLLRTDAGRINSEVKAIGQAHAGIESGQRLRFRLRANPTKRLSQHNPRAGEKVGNRVELTTDAEWQAWLERKGESSGFQLLGARTSRGDELGWKQLGRVKAKQDIVLAAVVFDGELIVRDLDRFHHALRQGIGPGKAYGFGLLSVAPADRS